MAGFREVVESQHKGWGQGKYWTIKSLAEAEEASLSNWDELHMQWRRDCQGAGCIKGEAKCVTCALHSGACSPVQGAKHITHWEHLCIDRENFGRRQPGTYVQEGRSQGTPGISTAPLGTPTIGRAHALSRASAGTSPGTQA